MEKDYVKMLIESNKPVEERLRIAGQLLNNMDMINENNERLISSYEKIIENYEYMIKVLKKTSAYRGFINDSEHEIRGNEDE